MNWLLIICIYFLYESYDKTAKNLWFWVCMVLALCC